MRDSSPPRSGALLDLAEHREHTLTFPVPYVMITGLECPMQEFEGFPDRDQVPPCDRVLCKVPEPHHFEGEGVPVPGQPRLDAGEGGTQLSHEGTPVQDQCIFSARGRK